MKCYYARPITLYNTRIEIEDRKLIEKLGFEVADPNCEEIQQIFKTRGTPSGIEACFKMVKECDVIAFRAFPDDKIGAGVVGEIKVAKNNDIPVFELPCDVFRRSLSIDETRSILRESGR